MASILMLSVYMLRYWASQMLWHRSWRKLLATELGKWHEKLAEWLDEFSNSAGSVQLLCWQAWHRAGVTDSSQQAAQTSHPTVGLHS